MARPPTFPSIHTAAELRQAELIRGGPNDREVGWAVARAGGPGYGTRIGGRRWSKSVSTGEGAGQVVGVAVVRTRRVRHQRKQSLPNQLVNSVQPPSKRGATVEVHSHILALAPANPPGPVMPERVRKLV